MKVLLSLPCKYGLEAQATVRVNGKRGATTKLSHGLNDRQRADGLLHPLSIALLKRSDIQKHLIYGMALTYKGWVRA